MKESFFNSTLALIAALGMIFAGFSASSDNTIVQNSQVSEQTTQVEAGFSSIVKKTVKRIKREVERQLPFRF